MRERKNVFYFGTATQYPKTTGLSLLQNAVTLMESEAKKNKIKGRLDHGGDGQLSELCFGAARAA